MNQNSIFSANALSERLRLHLGRNYIDTAFDSAKTLEEGVANYVSFMENRILKWYPEDILEDGTERARFVSPLTDITSRYWEKEIVDSRKYIVNSLNGELQDSHPPLLFVLVDCVSYFDCLSLLSKQKTKRIDYKFDYKISVFPSMTGACITSIFTGCFPREHHVPGNSYVDQIDGRFYNAFERLPPDTCQMNLLRRETDLNPYFFFYVDPRYFHKGPSYFDQEFVACGRTENVVCYTFDQSIKELKMRFLKDGHIERLEVRDFRHLLTQLVEECLKKLTYHTEFVYLYIPHLDRFKHKLKEIMPIAFNKEIDDTFGFLIKAACRLSQNFSGKHRIVVTSDHGSEYFFDIPTNRKVIQEKYEIRRKLPSHERFAYDSERVYMPYLKGNYLNDRIKKLQMSTDHTIYLNTRDLQRLNLIEEAGKNRPFGAIVPKSGYLLKHGSASREHGGISIAELLVPYVSIP